MFEGTKVIDLCDYESIFCSYLLAHVGCDVVAVEPPTGLGVRKMAPFYQTESLWWQAYGRGKQSLILDLDTELDDLLDLIDRADVLIHPFTKTQAATHGLDFDNLAVRNPKLVVVAITPFGSDGPKSDWAASDLTVWAASGAHYLGGDADRPPVRTSVPQSFLHASADAAGAALLALTERQSSGLGQYVDVSAQVSSAQAALAANLAVPNGSGYEVEREAGGLRGVFPIKMTWPCRDGHVAITLLFGPSFDEPNRRLLTWCMEEGHCVQEDVDTAWGQELMAMVSEQKSPEAYFELCKKVEAFTINKTQQALFEEGIKRGVYIAPTLDISGLMDEQHFRARSYWHQLQLNNPDDRTLDVPGAFAKFSRTPLTLPDAARPLGSTSRAQVFDNSKRDISPNHISDNSPSRPLEGLKVLDFMWVIAGPFFTRVLANHGATVIKLESSVRLEPARGTPTFKNAEAGIETSVPFSNFNTDKLSLTIDPANPMGREVILDLVRWADVVTESFSPKAMQGWGLDYDTLKKVNTDIIMLSSCLMGQTGPRASVAGYGNMAAALSGFYDLTGWADRSPAGPYLAYTDGVAPRFMLMSVLSALEHRRKTGEGQHIDISQAEAAIHLLAPAVYDYGLNGNIWHRAGNRDPGMAPNGVFPTAEDETWIAITAGNDSHWQALCHVLDIKELADDSAFATFAGRQANESIIEQQMAKATKAYKAEDLQAKLISAGVPAHKVLNSQAANADPQFKHRNHFIEVPHTATGSMVVENTRFQLSRTPGRVERAGPELGEHNFQVLKEILGYDDDRIADVYASLAME